MKFNKIYSQHCFVVVLAATVYSTTLQVDRNVGIALMLLALVQNLLGMHVLSFRLFWIFLPCWQIQRIVASIAHLLAPSSRMTLNVRTSFAMYRYPVRLLSSTSGAFDVLVQSVSDLNFFIRANYHRFILLLLQSL